jgi:ABC-type uncharacterized transport system substrate-binding protein
MTPSEKNILSSAKGWKETFGTGKKKNSSVEPAFFLSLYSCILSVLFHLLAVKQQILTYRPAMINAVGKRVLQTAMELKSIPLVQVMVPGSRRFYKETPAVTGVSLEVPPLTILKKLHKTLPGIKRIQVPFNPDYSTEFKTKAREAAELLHIELSTVPIRFSRELSPPLLPWKEKTDAVWMTPDPQSFHAFYNRDLLKKLANLPNKTGNTF